MLILSIIEPCTRFSAPLKFIIGPTSTAAVTWRSQRAVDRLSFMYGAINFKIIGGHND